MTNKEKGENDTVKIVLRLRFYTIHEFRIATSYLVNVQKSDFWWTSHLTVFSLRNATVMDDPTVFGLWDRYFYREISEKETKEK